FKKWKGSKTEEDKAIYTKAKKTVKQTIITLMEERSLEIAKSMEVDMKNFQIFKRLKKMNNEKKDIQQVKSIKDRDGNVIIDQEGIKSVWKRYMEDLLNQVNESETLTNNPPTIGPACQFSSAEIGTAIKKMKPNKAKGYTDLTSDMIKPICPKALNFLSNLFNKIQNVHVIPDDWKYSITVPIFKQKGDILNCASYRPIKLLEHAMKMFESVLEARIREIADVNGMQFAFRPGCSTSDPIFILRRLQESALSKGLKLYHVFIDLEKAFDRIPRPLIIWALRRRRVDEWIINLVMLLYRNTFTCVRTNIGDTEQFEINVGLHQGSVLSPLLFTIIVDAISEDIRSGLPFEMLYADDLILTANSIDELSIMFDKWKRCLECKGLKLNIEKTKVLITGEKHVKNPRYPCGVCHKNVNLNSIQCTACKKWIHKTCSGIKGPLKDNVNFICASCTSPFPLPSPVPTIPSTIEIAGSSLEVVTKFIYLGDVISSEGGPDLSLTSRIRHGWKKFNQLKLILTHKYISLHTKGVIYKMGIRPAITYASETWAMTKTNENRLLRTENRIILAMTSTKDLSVDDVRKKMSIEPISIFIRRNRLRYMGHIERMDENNWVKMVSRLDPSGKRRVGRPAHTWQKTITDDLRITKINPTLAQNRDLFRMKIHGI
ncbi:unnamed protein product, partial [Acanthocheilonema viteae]